MMVWIPDHVLGILGLYGSMVPGSSFDEPVNILYGFSPKFYFNSPGSDFI